MEKKTKIIRAEVSEEREELQCSNPECKERLHVTELVNLNAEFKGLKYDSLVCVTCLNRIHVDIELQCILNSDE